MSASHSKRPLEFSSRAQLRYREQQELEDVLRRFGRLTARGQLGAYHFIRDFLDEGVKENSADRMIAERAAALEAMAAVAKELGLPAGKPPTTTQFEQVSKGLGLNSSVSKVGRAWGGKWRFACQAFAGHRIHPSARQLALLEVGTGKRRRYENHRTSVQLWLETNPPIESVTAYDAWAREFNNDLPDGQLPVTNWNSIHYNLRVSLADLIRAARGDIRLEECPRKVADYHSGYGPLVSRGWIGGQRGLSPHAARMLVDRPGFPKPVVNLSGRRGWMKDDVQAYFDGRAFPERAEFELQAEYLGKAELAALMGKRPRMISQTTLVPEPAGLIGRSLYWRRDEAETWLAENAHRRR